MMNKRTTLVIFNVLFFICPMLYNASELYNSSMFIIVQYCTMIYSCTIVSPNSSQVQKHTAYSYTVSLNQTNGASLWGNSLLRHTLYTSTVQDLYLLLRFLLQRQSHTFYQGNTLELSISYD